MYLDLNDHYLLTQIVIYIVSHGNHKPKPVIDTQKTERNPIITLKKVIKHKGRNKEKDREKQ